MGLVSNDELPDTERPPPEEALREALEVIADALADINSTVSNGIENLERSLIQSIGSVREQQERDYSRVTRLDEQNTVHLRSIDTGIAKILKLLDPLHGRLDSMNERLASLERKGSNGAAAGH